MIKTLLEQVRPPPLLAKKIQQKTQFFLIRKFWIGKDPPPFPKKNRQFLITEILDWVRPPPPFGKKIQKNFNHFLIRKFWIRRDPPPFRINSEKNQFFLNDASPYDKSAGRLQQYFSHRFPPPFFMILDSLVLKRITDKTYS